MSNKNDDSNTKDYSEFFDGISVDEFKKASLSHWNDALGLNTIYVVPTDVRAFFDFFVKTFDKSSKPAAVMLAMGYANYIIQHCSNILSEKDIEISLRNELIHQHDLDEELSMLRKDILGLE